MKWAREIAVKPGKKVDLSRFNPDETFGITEDEANADIKEAVKKLGKLQNLLYADRRYAVLIVLQALDAGGKDGTIKHVMSSVNPQGCKVTSFKVPSSEEAAHDFLWRIHKAVPGRGEIGIFNRSQYEDVLVTRVHDLVPKDVWSGRYDQINSFESILNQNNVRVLKFYLHISKDEQKRRFEERITDPAKNWKISASDFTDRERWDDYTKAYEDALTKCNTETAPWYIVPANKKWMRNLIISKEVVKALKEMKLRTPEASIDLSKVKLD